MLTARRSDLASSRLCASISQRVSTNSCRVRTETVRVLFVGGCATPYLLPLCQVTPSGQLQVPKVYSGMLRLLHEQ